MSTVTTEALGASLRELPPRLRETVASSEVVLTMGAGDVFKLGQQLVAEGEAGAPSAPGGAGGRGSALCARGWA